MGPGDKHTHVRVFPGTISAWKMFPKEVPADASPGLAMEKGANACLSEVAERCKNVGIGTALEREFAARINANKFT